MNRKLNFYFKKIEYNWFIQNLQVFDLKNYIDFNLLEMFETILYRSSNK